MLFFILFFFCYCNYYNLSFKQIRIFRNLGCFKKWFADKKNHDSKKERRKKKLKEVEADDRLPTGDKKSSFQLSAYVLCVCFRLFIPVDNCSFIRRRHHARWRAVNFDPCSAFTAIEQWEFFSVLHLLLHGASVLKWSSLRTRDTHTYCWAFSSGAATTSFYDLGL